MRRSVRAAFAKAGWRLRPGHALVVLLLLASALVMPTGLVRAAGGQSPAADETAPTVTMSAPSGTTEFSPAVRRGNLSLRAEVADAGSDVASVRFWSFRHDGVGYSPTGEPVALTQLAPIAGSTYGVLGYLAEGRYLIQARAEDRAGNQRWSSPQYVEVDESPPSAALTSPVMGARIQGTVPLTGTATDANLAGYALELRGRQGTFPAGAGTTAVRRGTLASLETSAVPDGVYELALVVTDRAGNETTRTRTSLEVDNTGPAINSVETSSATEMLVGFTEPLAPDSVAGSSFVVDGLTITSPVLQADRTRVYLTTTAQRPGAPYTLTVSGPLADTLGNVLGAAAGSPAGEAVSAGFIGYGTPDLLAPVTALSTSPSAPNGLDGWFRSPVTATLTGTDPDGTPFTTLYDWNIESPASLWSGSIVVPLGTNTLYYRSTDVWGNQERVRSQEFKVDPDAAPPVLVAPTGSEASPAALSGSVNLRATASDTNSGIASVAFYLYRWNGTSYEAFGTEAGAPVTVPASGTSDIYEMAWNSLLTADGRYLVQAEMRDRAGNVAKSAGQSVMVDNTIPTLAVTSPVPGDFVKAGNVAIEGSVADTSLAQWRLELAPFPSGEYQDLASGTTDPPDETLFAWATAAQAEGRYKLRLTAVDAAGNSGAVVAGPITVDRTPPAVVDATPGPVRSVDVGFSEPLDPATVQPEGFVIPGLTVTAASVRADDSVRLTTSEQPRASRYRLSVRPSVTDRAGNPVASGSRSFTGRVPRPDAVAPAPPNGVEGLSAESANVIRWAANSEPDLAGYNVYRSDSAVGSFTLRLNSAPVQGDMYEDRAIPSAAVYHYRVAAVDAWGNESAQSAVASADRVEISRAIGPAGGTLASSNGDFTISIPAGALGVERTLTVTEGSRPDARAGLTFARPVYELRPAGIALAKPAAVTMRALLPRQQEGNPRAVFSPDGEEWTQMAGGATPGPVEHTVIGLTSGGGYFSVAEADREAPEILTVSPTRNAAEVPVTSHIALVFSDDMDGATLTDANIRLEEGGSAAVAARVAAGPGRRTVYVYPETLLATGRNYSVVVSGRGVKDAAGNPLGRDFRSRFSTADAGVSPHDAYATAGSLCDRCHPPAASGPQSFTSPAEPQVCATCHDGTGSRYRVQGRYVDQSPASEVGDGDGSTAPRSLHPVTQPASSGTGVTMQCSHCHNAHGMEGTGPRLLAVKKLDPTMSGIYGPKTGNLACWTCHDATAAASQGFLPAASWNASTGYDHRTYYPPPGMSHNKLDGTGFSPADTEAPSKEGIACKGCHSDHDSPNTKLISATVNMQEVSFDSSSATALNATYNSLCDACHTAAGIGGPGWLGAAVYAASGHGASVATSPLGYLPTIPAANQALQVRVCKQCHEPHGTGDENGAYPELVRDFEERLCFRCHASTGRPTGADDLATVFERDYGHDLTMSDTASRRHDASDEASARLNPSAAFAGANRHVECADCHNTHAAKNELHVPGSNAVPGVLQGVAGVEATATAGAFSAPSSWQWRPAYPATETYQVCFKCHSAAAYGASPPARASQTRRGPGYWPVRTYTDQAKEFNPANESYHAVWGPSKARPDFGSYVNGWSATSRMDCLDCHRSDNAADPRGAHASGTPFLLGGYAEPSSSRYVTGPNGAANYASVAERNVDFAFCFGCHSEVFTDTAFKTPAGVNLHTATVGAEDGGHGLKACTNCHAAVPHGMNRPHLLVTTSDPAPYNDHAGRAYGIVATGSSLGEQAGQWTQADCATVGACHAAAEPPSSLSPPSSAPTATPPAPGAP